MDKTAAGSDAVPKMSVLLICGDKTKGGLFKKQVEDENFKEIRVVEYS